MTPESEQEASEARGLTEGERRYVQRCERAYSAGAATGAPPVRHFMEACIEWLEADLRLKVEELTIFPEDAPIPPGPLPRWIEWVCRVGESTAAYLTLKTALNAIPLKHASNGTARLIGDRPLSTAAHILMSALLDEYNSQIFYTADEPAFCNAINNRANSKLQRSMRLRSRMDRHGVARTKMPSAKETLDVGSHLLMAMCESTGAFTIEEVRDHRCVAKYKTRLMLIPAEATLQWIATRSDRLRLTQPMHPPTLIPPKDWSASQAGGYHYALAGTLPLVRHASAAQILKLSSTTMPLVYSALNALQRTAWRVNGKLLTSVMSALDGRLSTILPGPRDDVIPPKPLDPGLLTAWRTGAADIYTRNAVRRIKRGDAERAVVVALDLRERERFYYPYNLDFRGRAYPAVEFLNPHGPDVVRGLLEFAEGIPLTKRGAGWLAVHGANCLGKHNGQSLSKLSFQERVDVIKEITPRILGAAEDPAAAVSFWGAADEPWQFLAFCMEWSEWTRTGALETHLPIGLDGTANGLQHFSAILRDPVAAANVSMTQTNRPADIYAAVAEKLKTRLAQQAATEPVAALWLTSGLVTRSLVKRPVMTLAYGATRYGFVDQILSTLRSGPSADWLQARKVFGLAHVRIRVAAQFLSAVLWDTLSETVGGALTAMSWLQEAATQVASVTGGPVAWTVPLTGFPAHMEYWRQRRSQLKTWLNGTILQPSVWSNTNKPNHTKTTNAIAPNVVHSLDAAAMMATTVACAARGVPAFSMIHDSYACHAEYVPIMADALRTSFIDLYYDRDTLADLAQQWRAAGCDIPDPPVLGDFDVRDVRHADYFFN